jgi:cell division protein FtsZ
MSDEIRITVVATGLGQAQQQEVRVANGGTAKAVSRSAPGKNSTDYSQLELPTVLRNRAEERTARAAPSPAPAAEAPAQALQKTGTDDMDFLDIPAFLRRQAD